MKKYKKWTLSVALMFSFSNFALADECEDIQTEFEQIMDTFIYSCIEHDIFPYTPNQICDDWFNDAAVLAGQLDCVSVEYQGAIYNFMSQAWTAYLNGGWPPYNYN